MTSGAHAGLHMAAVVVATAVAAVACGGASKPTPQTPVAAGAKLETPKRKKTINVVYPPTLKGQGIEADVTVMLSLDEAGRVVRVRILKESPYPEFNEAARQAAMGEEFEPALRDGLPIAYAVSFTYRFRSEDQ